MDSYTNLRFTLQLPAEPSSPPTSSNNNTGTSVDDSSSMDLDPKGEAAGVLDASEDQDTGIKRETSDGLDGNTNISDIPTSAAAPGSIPTPASTKSEPRSSQPPSTHQAEPPAEEAMSIGAKPSAAARAATKKGTASLVKKTTNRKSGGRSRAGKGARGGSKTAAASKKFKSAAAAKSAGTTIATSSSPAPAGSDIDDDDDDDDEEEEDEESDHGPYCICRGPDDHRWMISCDVCEDWFHGECVSIDKVIGEALIQRYVCPGCTDDKGINVTRYKKTCSLEGCLAAARIYGEQGARSGHKGSAPVGGNYSVFCSDKHAEEWWEQLVRSLPENSKLRGKEADLTREKFMGLLTVSTTQQPVEGEEPWSIGKKPFGIPAEFWSQVDHALVLTPEEQNFLSASAADRYALAEEIVLNKKMQQLLDVANERRKAAIAAGQFDKDTCGYDARLDLVGSPAEFALFVKSPQGEAIYKSNSLAGEATWTEEQLAALQAKAAEDAKEWTLATAGMCDRRRCKPHASWYNIFTKSTRHLIKELARQAKEKLDAETRVREAAATRYFRSRHERTAVRRLDAVVT